MNNIAVIGAGVMGRDVALNLALFDKEVMLVDNSDEVLAASAGHISKSLKMVKMMNPAWKSSSKEEVLSRIKFTADYSLLADTDVIIENVSEDLGTKLSVYNALKEVCGNDTYYFVNTSCISITKIASIMPQADRVIGVHFMNPVPLKPTVEVIKGYHTTDETVDYLKSFLKELNKTGIVVNDYPGFVANRLSHLFMNEAAFLIQDQVAGAKEVDMIFKKGYGHAMGPLETADLIGLDTVVDSLEVLYNSYQDSKFRCCPLMKKMVDAGLLGKKSGQGFYSY